VLAQLLELVERVRQGARRDDDHLAIDALEGGADRATDPQEVVGLAGENEDAVADLVA
jgi:hypothetical protein